MKKCPYCAEEIQDEAIVCRYCGRELGEAAKAAAEAREVMATGQQRLQEVANRYIAAGYIPVSSGPGTATLKHPKTFDGCLFIILLFLGIILGIVYLIFYAVQTEKLVTLTLQPDGSISEVGPGVLQQAAPYTPRDPLSPEVVQQGKGKDPIILAVIGILIIAFFVYVIWMSGQ